MATATPNILINSISGKMGNVVFYVRRSTQCVRMYVIPRNPDTEAQRLVRRAFGDAVRSWQSMCPEERYAYIRKARYLNMSGYNLYISEYLKRVMQAVDRTSKDNLNSNPSSLPWNLLPLPERFPSVSDSYILPYTAGRLPGVPQHSPG